MLSIWCSTKFLWFTRASVRTTVALLMILLYPFTIADLEGRLRLENRDVHWGHGLELQGTNSTVQDSRVQ